VGSYEAVEDVLRVNRSLVIPLDELEWRFTPSGGPGGQHANRSNTRAEVRFDIAGSPSLGPRQRARLLDRFGPSIRVAVDDERSQLRNRAVAQERLAARLKAALRVDKERRPTAPSQAARRRRLEEKRRRGLQKQQRRPPAPNDD
jgi:ribosome-associated protein